MKKTVLCFIVALVACFAATGFAQETAPADQGITLGEILTSSPAIKTGVFFNLNDSKFQLINCVTIVQFKDMALDLGYADQQIICASLNYDLIKLEQLGVSLPILKELVANIGWTAGWKRVTGSNEFCTGPGATLKVKVQF